MFPILESEKGKEEFIGECWNALIEQEQTVSSRPKDKNVAMIEQAIADGAQAAATRKMSADEAINKRPDFQYLKIWSFLSGNFMNVK